MFCGRNNLKINFHPWRTLNEHNVSSAGKQTGFCLKRLSQFVVRRSRWRNRTKSSRDFVRLLHLSVRIKLRFTARRTAPTRWVVVLTEPVLFNENLSFLAQDGAWKEDEEASNVVFPSPPLNPIANVASAETAQITLPRFYGYFIPQGCCCFSLAFPHNVAFLTLQALFLCKDFWPFHILH